MKCDRSNMQCQVSFTNGGNIDVISETVTCNYDLPAVHNYANIIPNEKLLTLLIV